MFTKNEKLKFRQIKTAIFGFENIPWKKPPVFKYYDSFVILTRKQGMNQLTVSALYHVIKDYVMWYRCWYFEKILFNLRIKTAEVVCSVF